MRAYADTNFFAAVLAESERTPEALKLLAGLEKGKLRALPIPNLLQMEIINALQRMIFESRNGVQSYRMSPESAAIAEATFIAELEVGSLWRTSLLTTADLEPAFHTLAHRHTAKLGFRTYDILHVASALLLGCQIFWSFDEKARQLATLEGLTIN